MRPPREAEDEWLTWLRARGALAFALEAEVQALDGLNGFAADAADAAERLGDAIERLLREIEHRPPPPALTSLRDTLRAYLTWRRAVNDRIAAALRSGGWESARGVLAHDLEAGAGLYEAYLAALRVVEQRLR